MIQLVRNPHPDISPGPPFGVRAIRAGDTLYLSGCTSRDTDAAGKDVITQAKVALDKIKRIVEAHGGTSADIVRLTIWVTDIESFREPPTFDAFTKLMDDMFEDVFPTNTLIGTTGLAKASMNIEIEATAVF